MTIPPLCFPMGNGTRAGLATLLLTAAAATGCATTREAPAMPTPAASPSASDPSSPAPAPPAGTPAESTAPPLSSTELPTRKPPGKPPKTPTDLVPTDVIAGRVTRGGSGPCYGLITDDGTEYAVYSPTGRALGEGTFVRIRFESLRIKIDCGPGRPVRALEITILS